MISAILYNNQTFKITVIQTEFSIKKMNVSNTEDLLGI